MGEIKKGRTNTIAAVIAVLSIAAIAVWQFYLFVTFKSANGLVDVQGGTHHLWWAIGIGFIACLVGFLAFSVLLRYDKNDEMHITS
jgi:Kef-type K+ transport system membrane component KefB